MRSSFKSESGAMAFSSPNIKQKIKEGTVSNEAGPSFIFTDILPVNVLHDELSALFHALLLYLRFPKIRKIAKKILMKSKYSSNAHPMATLLARAVPP